MRRVSWCFGIALALYPALTGAAPVDERPAPLLYVRVQGPPGLTVTFLEGVASGRTFQPPVTVGLRPGYHYRLRLEGLPGQPNAVLYPTLEVGGTLCLPPRLKAADFPAPITFTEDDLSRVIGGAMVTKVLVVEDPGKAPFPFQDPDRPSEWELQPHEDPFRQAKTFGRPVLTVRLGLREPENAELLNLPRGQILYPGMLALSPPTQPPTVNPAYYHDPRLCTDRPNEYLTDGGDKGTPLYLERNGHLRGLDPSDTVAEYLDSKGERHLAVTNEVCVFAPRFLAIRHLLPPLIYESRKPPLGMNGLLVDNQIKSQTGLRETDHLADVQAMRQRQILRAGTIANPVIQLQEMQLLGGLDLRVGPGGFLGTERVRTLDELEKAKLVRQVELALRLSTAVSPKAATEVVGPKVVGQVQNLGAVTGTLETRTAVYLCEKIDPVVPERPLRVYKWASAEGAKVGDVVTFFIRYANLGGRAIRDVAVTDSLTQRLEYVTGSGKSDREALFVTQDNEAGSVTLRWEIKPPLGPGEQGIVSFQARVR